MKAKAALIVLVAALGAQAEPEEFAYCTVCHGAEGNGNPVIGAPKIAGLEPWYLTNQLRAFRAGWRGVRPTDAPGQEMHHVAVAIPDEETMGRAVAFVGTLAAKPPPITIKGNTKRGAEQYAPCAACHGESGQGNAALQAPALVGQSDWYLAAELTGYRAGERGAHPDDSVGAQMRAMAATLPDERAIVDVVAYLNSLR
jgi:cytochrome c553